MPENNDAYQPISFDAIKIGLASPEKILQWSHGETVCSVKEYSDRARIGNVIVVNTRRYATKAQSVTDVE